MRFLAPKDEGPSRLYVCLCVCVCGCAYWSVSSLGNNINMRLLCQSISPLTILRHRKLIFWQPEVLGVPPQPPPPPLLHKLNSKISYFPFHILPPFSTHKFPSASIRLADKQTKYALRSI